MTEPRAARRLDLMRATAVAALFAFVSTPTLAGETLTIGSVEEDVQAERAKFSHWQRYLEAHLRAAEVDVEAVELVVQTSIVDIAHGFDSGEIDLYLDSPVLAALVARSSNATPFVRSWKEGVAEYSTLIYTRADSPVRTIADLAGRTVAFKKRESTPGYFMPRGHFEAAGLPMVPVEAPGAPVPNGHVGYVFSHGDQTTLGWVITGRVDAGVMKDDMIEAPRLRGVRDQIRVVAETEPMPRQVLTRRADMEPSIVAALHDILTTMHEDPKGREVLAILDETAKFDDFPMGAERVFDRINAMLDALEVTLEPAS